MTARNGDAEWHGDIESGAGTITVGGAFSGGYSYSTRFAQDEGLNPEQLFAAAYSGCFTMALAGILGGAGHAADSLQTNARVGLRHVEGQPTLTRIYVDTVGDVPGIDEDQFQTYAERAKAECPMSWAVAGIPEIVLTAALGGAQSTAAARMMNVDDQGVAGGSPRAPGTGGTGRRAADRHYPAVLAAETRRLALELRATQATLRKERTC